MPLTRLQAGALCGAAIIGLGCGVYASAHTSRERAISEAVEAFRQSLISADGVRLDSLADPAFSFSDGAGQVLTRSQFIAAVTTGRRAFRNIAVDDPRTEIIGDVAIVRHIFQSDALLQGEPARIEKAVVEIWRWTDRWRILAHQAYDS